MLANTHEAVGNSEETAAIWNYMTLNKVMKIPGLSSATINGETDSFYMDSDHPYPKKTIFGLLQIRLISFYLERANNAVFRRSKSQDYC